jgi:hypothetical protein
MGIVMQSKFCLETLECRKLLSGSPVSATIIGETAGAVASARAKVTAAPQISITQRTMYFNAIHGESNTQVLRITNNGNANLDLRDGSVVLAGSARKLFSVNFPAGGFSIKPGRRLDLNVTFNSPAGTTQVQIARLAIVTNDPSMPSVTVGLRGLPTAGIGGNLEPSLQRVLDTFGLQINVGDATPDEYQLGTPVAGNDEVTGMQQLVKAGAGPVSIRPLAVFGTDNGPAVRVGYYTPGNPNSAKQLWYVPREDAQSVNPKVYGQTLIDPGSAPFSLFAEFPGFINTNGDRRYVYSEDGLNSIWEPKNSELHKIRFYPLIDQLGNRAADTYVVAVEEYTAEYDVQDVVFVITNVKPVEVQQPTISVQPIMQAPGSPNVVFNKVEIPNEVAPNHTKLTSVVRVRNTGNAPLTVTFGVSGNFVIDKNGGTNVVMQPGAVRDVNLRFIAVSGAVHTGALTLTSNDPNRPTVSVPLKGYWQQYSEQTPAGKQLEPSLKTIVNDLFGYTTRITNDGQSLSTLAKVQATGEEILSPYWRTADDNSPVRVTTLATFKFQADVTSEGEYFPSNDAVAFHYKGSSQARSTYYTARGDGQSVLPRKQGQLSSVASAAFRPGDQAFGFIVERTEYSDPTKNPDRFGRTGYGHYIRFWPARDGNGMLIPNTYIMVHDYNRDFTNYDYQDGVYLVENIVPENAVKSPLTVFTEETSKGARISFTSPATGPRINGFRVYRSATANGTYTLLTDTPLARRPVTTFIDTSVTPDQTFYYQIVSLGSNGEESFPVTVMI